MHLADQVDFFRGGEWAMLKKVEICDITTSYVLFLIYTRHERWGAGVETQKYVRWDIGEWGRVPFNESYAPSLSTIYDGA